MKTTARRDIALELSPEQCSLIVEGLAERPFRQVFELIGQLHAGAHAGGASARLTFSPAQLRLILDTLGGMPFSRVNRLLQSMQQQMRMDQY
ncbi:hypothetical protein [Duganella radicis]|uniref:Uncharacterized protein n=1 Tax=Duganella radicis TaxID=551988 RepID=A0A6L6PD94_9BURK|nr:hypothetical protein [Duganella radicis]MTV36315.1 hypothetical protein [Duganella radicis]